MEAFCQLEMQRDDLQGFFQAANTGADVRLSFFPPVILKGHSSISGL